jgi:hypothetical protein
MDDDQTDLSDGDSERKDLETRVRVLESHAAALVRIVKRLMDTPESENVSPGRLTEMRDSLRWLMELYAQRDQLLTERSTVQRAMENQSTRQDRREKLLYIFLGAICTFIVTAVGGYLATRWK